MGKRKKIKKILKSHGGKMKYIKLIKQIEECKNDYISRRELEEIFKKTYRSL